MRANFSEGQEILSGDLNGITKSIEKGLYENVLHQLLKKPVTAFFGNGFHIAYKNATQVTVFAGNGVQYDSSQTSPETTRRPLNLATNTDLTIAAAHATLPRIDIVSVKWKLEADATISRNFKDVDDGTVSSISTITRNKWTCDLVVTTGTANASPVAPSTPAGYTKLADVLVTAVTGVVAQASITNSRSVIPSGKFKVLWYPVNGLAPNTAEENSIMVDLFELSAGQAMTAMIVVPDDYVAGYPIKLNIAAYSPGTSNNFNLQVVSTLIRAGTDAISSTTNQKTTTSGNVTNTSANMMKRISFYLTDFLGQINSVAVSPGDIIIAKLTRIAITSGSDDTNDVRIVDGGTEGVF